MWAVHTKELLWAPNCGSYLSFLCFIINLDNYEFWALRPISLDNEGVLKNTFPPSKKFGWFVGKTRVCPYNSSSLATYVNPKLTLREKISFKGVGLRTQLTECLHAYCLRDYMDIMYSDLKYKQDIVELTQNYFEELQVFTRPEESKPNRRCSDKQNIYLQSRCITQSFCLSR